MRKLWERLVLVLALVAGPASSDPAAPAPGPLVASLRVGVFCALQAMDQRPAPGTLSGWIHVPDGMIDFHWPERQIVPAAIGLAFGVKSQLMPGKFVQGEMRVYRPGSTTPEVWESSFSDIGEQFGFFRFDREDELVHGVWRFEAWDGETQLYSVEFEVVPAAALPEIVTACGAIS
ncbi:MAG: DUF3859 domain-containing protein [Rhodobacterales bacterium]|nr:DUF3859 domain-containing protein [Rhodobacterales bacterium]